MSAEFIAVLIVASFVVAFIGSLYSRLLWTQSGKAGYAFLITVLTVVTALGLFFLAIYGILKPEVDFLFHFFS